MLVGETKTTERFYNLNVGRPYQAIEILGILWKGQFKQRFSLCLLSLDYRLVEVSCLVSSWGLMIYRAICPVGDQEYVALNWRRRYEQVVNCLKERDWVVAFMGRVVLFLLGLRNLEIHVPITR